MPYSYNRRIASGNPAWVKAEEHAHKLDEVALKKSAEYTAFPQDWKDAAEAWIVAADAAEEAGDMVRAERNRAKVPSRKANATLVTVLYELVQDDRRAKGTSPGREAKKEQFQKQIKMNLR